MKVNGEWPLAQAPGIPNASFRASAPVEFHKLLTRFVEQAELNSQR